MQQPLDDDYLASTDPISIDAFKEILAYDLKNFVDNMKHLKKEPTDYSSWFMMFGAWSEVRGIADGHGEGSNEG